MKNPRAGGRVPTRASDASEADLREWIRTLARSTGWRLYFTHRSDRSPAGWPDVQLVRGDRLVLAELKRDLGPKGGGPAPTDEQRGWLDALARVTRVDACLWRPADLDAIAATLSANEEAPGLWVPAPRVTT